MPRHRDSSETRCSAGATDAQGAGVVTDAAVFAIALLLALVLDRNEECARRWRDHHDYQEDGQQAIHGLESTKSFPSWARESWLGYSSVCIPAITRGFFTSPGGRCFNWPHPAKASAGHFTISVMFTEKHRAENQHGTKDRDEHSAQAGHMDRQPA